MATDYYDTRDLQELTGIPKATWRYWHSVGQGPPSFKVGCKRLYRKTVVHQWLSDLESGKEGGKRMARSIPACELRETDVLEFQGVTSAGGVNGIPIDKLTRRADGRVEIDVIYLDGTHRHKTFAADEQVVVRG
jgi:hypothetical protein